MNWKLKKSETQDAGTKDILSFTGSGKISVSVESIVQSAKVQRQVDGVKQIAANNQAAVLKPK